MQPPLPPLQEGLQTAFGLLQAGRTAQARRILDRLANLYPRAADVHWLQAGMHVRQGDLAAAEVALRATISLDPARASAHALLGEVLSHTGRNGDAERSLRHALALQPEHAPAATNLAYILLSQGQPEAALHLLDPFIRLGARDAELLMVQGQALLAVRRFGDAIAVFEQLVRHAPGHTNGIVGLASALVEAGEHARAKELMQRVVGTQAAPPEAHFVLAHALMSGGDTTTAIAELRTAVHMQPGYVSAQLDLCRLVWLQTGNTESASAELDAALQQQPALSSIRVLKAKLLENSGALDAAISVLEAGLGFGSGMLELTTAIAQVAIKCNPQTAIRYAEDALRLAPGNHAALAAYCAALLGTDRAAEAAEAAAKLHAARPTDCYFMALQACAFRALGDPRYNVLYDYAFVFPQYIDVPPGWTSRAAYLADLAQELRALHGFRAHPINQSLRLGTQADLDFSTAPGPALRAFPNAIDGPIRRYMAHLGTGTDEFRRRNNGRYQLNGAWSVRLRPHGFHVNHVHPDGWLSSACYIELPDGMDSTTHAGWIQFGQPGFLTSPVLAAEHFVRPEPGLLALFPSYMWHGTVPFDGTADSRRMTIAFDVIPGGNEPR